MPKVLVAQQGRIIEAVVDEGGELLPSVPVISVVADPADLWHVAAALTSPVASAWAAARHLGTGRAATSVRLRPVDVTSLPVPVDHRRWDEAAELARRGQALADAGDGVGWRRTLVELGRVMVAAHGLDDPELVRWWSERLPDPLRS